MLTNYFQIQEFVPKEVHDKFKDRSAMFLDPRLFVIADYLRARFGSMTINNWLWGGKFNHSGYRQPDCPDGAFFSIHKTGGAIDPKFKDVTPDDVRSDIAKLESLYMTMGITTIELNTPTWVHIDTRFTGMGNIQYFKP